MYYPAELVLTSYLPLTIEIGMRFVNIRNPGTDNEIIELIEITKATLREVPSDIDRFFEKYGTPVELLVVDGHDTVLATHEQIGWFDPGDESDEYRDIELKDINIILQEYEGQIEIEIDDVAYNYGAINPIIEEGKVIIRPL